MYKEGYTVSIYGVANLKATVFSETEPSSVEVEKLINLYSGVRAFVSPCKNYTLNSVEKV